MNPTKVLLVEDQPFFVELLENTFQAEPEFELLGSATEGEAAIELARKTSPDVVIMDIKLAGEMNGVEAGLKIKEHKSDTAIVLLSAHMERGYLTSLPSRYSSGWAYLLKQTLPDVDTLLRTIRQSVNGMVVLDPMLVQMLDPAPDSPLSRLTDRQLQLLRLMAQGYDNPAIALELSLSQNTVETYINTIYQELGTSAEPGVHARVSATLIYLRESNLLV